VKQGGHRGCARLLEDGDDRRDGAPRDSRHFGPGARRPGAPRPRTGPYQKRSKDLPRQNPLRKRHGFPASAVSRHARSLPRRLVEPPVTTERSGWPTTSAEYIGVGSLQQAMDATWVLGGRLVRCWPTTSISQQKEGCFGCPLDLTPPHRGTCPEHRWTGPSAARRRPQLVGRHRDRISRLGGIAVGRSTTVASKRSSASSVAQRGHAA
jgi:hypothetical protein